MGDMRHFSHYCHLLCRAIMHYLHINAHKCGWQLATFTSPCYKAECSIYRECTSYAREDSC